MKEIPSLNQSQTRTQFILYPTLLRAEPSRISLVKFLGKQVTVKLREPSLTLEGTLIHVDRSLKHDGFGNVILENDNSELIIVKGNFVQAIVLEAVGKARAGKSTISPSAKITGKVTQPLRNAFGPYNMPQRTRR